MPGRVAHRFEWRRVVPPPMHNTRSYYLATPTQHVALNAWRAHGSYWRWGILAFVDGAFLLYRSGDAPTLNEAKLRAEIALPDNVPPRLWDYRKGGKTTTKTAKVGESTDLPF